MRPWKKLSAEEQERLCRCPVSELPAAAEEVGVPYASALLNRSKRLAGVKPAPTPILDKWLVGQGNLLIIGDAQVPCHDADFINKCLSLGTAWGIEQLLWLGDYYNFDYLGPHIPEIVIPSTQEEREAGMETFLRAGGRFARQYWSMGNHDVRCVKAVAALGFKPEMALKMLAPESVITSTYHFAEWHNGGRKWYLEHPGNTSVNPGAVGKDLAARELCNVVVAHGHLIGIRHDMSDRFLIIDSGGAFHPAKLAYYAKRHNRRPKMNQGAVMLHDGLAYLIDPRNIDWDLMEWAGQRKSR